MGIAVNRLEMRHFEAVATRNKIHELTDRAGGPTFRQREAFAEAKGLRNVVKYWPWQAVLEACGLWRIEPVLTKQGRNYVRSCGGFDWSEQQEVKREPKAPESNVQREAPKVERNEIGLPDELDRDAAERERQRKLNALRDMIRTEIEAFRGKDDDALKELIAGVSSAAADAILATKGGELLESLRKQGEDTILEAMELIEKARPVVLHVQINDGEQRKVDGKVHRAFKQVMQLAAMGKNIAMVGPTGCGKTHLAKQVAEALNREYGTQSVTMGMSEAKIIGGLLPTGEAGRFEPFIADFLVKARDGGVFLLDEFDSVDPNVALIVNQLLANGRIDVPGVGTIHAHKNFVCIAALNTYGTGADRQYVGRSQLDEATLDRFRIGMVEMDYDQELESGLIHDKSWREKCWQIRAALRQNRIRRNMSTRFMLDGQDMMRGAGWTQDQVLASYTAGWSPDDKAKIGVR